MKEIVTSRHKKGSALEIDEETGRVYDPADPKEWRGVTKKDLRQLAKYKRAWGK